jgi:16S rRNA (uracil1498-N3)-methyltransferase
VHLFYQPDLTSDLISLSEDESKHAIRVLRLSIGDQVEIVDGKGTRAVAEVTSDHAKRCELRVVSRIREESPRKFYLHIAVAPTKNNERLEWFLEKATEIGIDEITLLDCEHSERSTVKSERLEKVAVSAMKQSQQSWLPVINEIISFDKFVKEASADLKLIAHCDEGGKNSIAQVFSRQPSTPRLPQHGQRVGGQALSLTTTSKNILVLIGPEGDFSNVEIETALGNQFTAVSLGETRLRTETAALYAVTAINLLQ